MDALISLLAEPLGHEFMRRALLMTLLVGIACAVFSCFLILKGWSLMGDAVSHAVLPGLVLAHVLAIPLAIGAFFSGLFCAVAVGYLKENSRVKEDAVMGIVFSGMFGLGLIGFTKIETDVHLLHVLFGNVLGISPGDMLEASLIAIAGTLVMLAKRRDFLLHTFDPVHARVVGLPVRVLQFGLLILLALTIVAALKAVGIILVIAMLIAPGAIGFLLTKSFDRMLAVAVGAAVLSCFAGVILSYHLDTATAPLIVVIQGLLFTTALLTAKAIARRKRLAQGMEEPQSLSAEIHSLPSEAKRSSKELSSLRMAASLHAALAIRRLAP